jgi:hypothetical protein
LSGRVFSGGGRIAWTRLARLAALAGVLGAVSAPTPASAAPGILEASVVECAVIDGQLQATVGVSITGASPNTAIWLRIFHPLDVAPPPKVSAGSTDANGLLSNRFLAGTAEDFPVGVRAYTSGTERIDPESEIGGVVAVEFVCPVLTPQDVVDGAIESGVLTEREATPLAVKLGAVAAQEESGNIEAAINLLRAARQQIDALVTSRRATPSEVQPLLDAINGEIQRLGGTP